MHDPEELLHECLVRAWGDSCARGGTVGGIMVAEALAKGDARRMRSRFPSALVIFALAAVRMSGPARDELLRHTARGMAYDAQAFPRADAGSWWRWLQGVVGR